MLHRRALGASAALVLAVAACEQSAVTPPAETEAVFSELELAQLADLDEYIGMARSGVDMTGDEAQELNRRIMERFPVREEVLEEYRSRADASAGASVEHERPVAGIGEATVPTTPEGLIPGSGPAGQVVVPDDVGTIQAAITGAAPGETIVVRPGVYYETVVLDGLSNLTIVGLGAEINGGLQLDGDNLIVAGFTLTGFSPLFLRNGSGNGAIGNLQYGFYQGMTLVNTVDGFLTGNQSYGGTFGLVALAAEGGVAEGNTVAANLIEGADVGAINLIDLSVPSSRAGASVGEEYEFEAEPSENVRDNLILGNALSYNNRGISLEYVSDTQVFFNLGNCNSSFFYFPGSTTTTFGNWSDCSL